MRCPRCGSDLVQTALVDHDDHYHRNWMCLCGIDAVDPIEIPKEY